MSTITLPNLSPSKLYESRYIGNIPVVDCFIKSIALDHPEKQYVSIWMTIREGSLGDKLFIIHNRYVTIGITEDPHIAFGFWNNVDAFSLAELLSTEEHSKL